MSNAQCSRSEITRSISHAWLGTKLDLPCLLATLNGQRFQMSSGYSYIASSSYFDLQSDRSPDEYWTVYASVDRLVADHYRDYKLKAHNQLKAHGLSRPYGGMSAKDWQSALTSSPVLLS
ncbi:hypothetical protein Adt_45796 [Abeliophyllum distichum]|uniref:Uncharacterized protein n=1 Tax=Abeliophyllum distichum TaxID=126358 RepID=A0ABD1NNX2_9LAMI